MYARPFSIPRLADLLETATVLERVDLGAVMATLGVSPAYGCFCVTQTITGLEIVSERAPNEPEDHLGLMIERVAETIMAGFRVSL